MKPTIALLFIVLIAAAATSTQCRRFSSGGGGGKHKKEGEVWKWFPNATEKIDNANDVINIGQQNRDSYIDIENACTDCQNTVFVQCKSNNNRDYGEDWLEIENSIRYDFVLNQTKQNLVVTCYADFGQQAWGHSKGFFAGVIGERCFDCNWRFVNGGKVELKAEDGFVKSYELSGDSGAVGICQGEKCR